jgi:hypothetical protein
LPEMLPLLRPVFTRATPSTPLRNDLADVTLTLLNP